MFVMQRPVRLAAALLVSGIVNTLRSSSQQGVSYVCVCGRRKVEGRDLGQTSGMTWEKRWRKGNKNDGARSPSKAQ